MHTPGTPVPAHELHSVLSQAYSDLYKETHGIRPRWMRFSEMATPALERAMLSLMEEAEEAGDLVAEWDGVDPRCAADEEAARVEAVRAHEERYMDAAASWGACGW